VTAGLLKMMCTFFSEQELALSEMEFVGIGTRRCWLPGSHSLNVIDSRVGNWRM